MRFSFANRRRRSREEALVWLARLKRGLRQAEGPELLTWLKRHSHRIAIAKAAVEWHGPEVLAVLSDIFPIPPSILEPQRRLRPALLAAAALAGACITVGVPIAILLMAGIHRYAYASAQQATRRLTLEDGTLVELNRGTQINVTYAAKARSVLIARGEALFEVASKPDSPFYIHAAGRNFETTSATFDIRFAAPERLSLVVLKGAVLVLPPLRPGGKDRPILLEPRQMLTIEHEKESGRALTERDLHSRLAWQRGS